MDLYPGCPCLRCDSQTWDMSPSGFTFARMTLCPTCGNKRCPGAADHDNPCGGSNKPGQVGSNYESVPYTDCDNDCPVCGEGA